MTDYTKVTIFADKDSLPATDVNKKILGAEWDTEFDAINVAVASKYELGDLASQAQAEAGTDNTVIMTPLGTVQYIDATQQGSGFSAHVAATQDYVIQTAYQVEKVAVTPSNVDSDTFIWTCDPDRFYLIEMYLDHSYVTGAPDGTPGDGRIAVGADQSSQNSFGIQIDTDNVDRTGYITNLSDQTVTDGTSGAAGRPTHLMYLIHTHLTLETTYTLTLTRDNAGVASTYINEGSWMRVTNLGAGS